MKRIDKISKMIDLKKELEQKNGNATISRKDFKRKYDLNVCEFARHCSTKHFTIQVKLRKHGHLEKLTIQQGVYEILQNNSWVRITLDNFATYATYDKDFYCYRWKENFVARLQVYKYYYRYSEIINGLKYSITNNVNKEQKKIYSLEQQKIKACAYYDSKIREVKQIVKKFQLEN